MRPKRLRFLPLWFENVDTQLKKLNEPATASLEKSNSSSGEIIIPHFSNESVLVKPTKEEIKRDASNASIASVVPEARVSDLSDDGNEAIELR